MRLRILATSYDYRPRLGGVATCAFQVCRALAELGEVDLLLLAPRAPGGEEFDRHGQFRTLRIPLPKTAAMSVIPLAARMAAETIRWRPHAILNFLWMPCGVSSLLTLPIRAVTRTPYFVILHGAELVETDTSFKKRLRRRLSFMKNLTLRRAAMVFPVSRFTGDLAANFCDVPTDQICVTNNGVDPTCFAPGPKPPRLVEKYQLHGKKIFFTVARLLDFKGVDFAIQALKEVISTHPEVVYLVSGEGPDRPRLEKMVQDLDLAGHIVFTGAIHPDDLADFYRLCDCFVLLTRTDWKTPNLEGFGLVFLEAAACGKPSIAGNSGGIPDAVADQVSGWLVNPTDVQEIAFVMRKCLDLDKEREMMGLRALDRAHGWMTWNHMARRIQNEILENVQIDE